MPVKTTDIVVCRVDDFLDGNIRQNVSERSEITKRYRVDDVHSVTRGDLNEAELLGVVVEAVGFCIQGDGMGAHQLTGESTELSGRLNDLDWERYLSGQWAESSTLCFMYPFLVREILQHTVKVAYRPSLTICYLNIALWSLLPILGFRLFAVNNLCPTDEIHLTMDVAHRYRNPQFDT